MIKASMFTRAADNRPELVEYADFDALAQSLGTFRVVGPTQEDKKRTPCICPAEFAPEAKRSKAAVVRVWFGLLDFDGPDHLGLTEAQVDQVLTQADGLTTFFYTTHGHHEAQKRGLWKFRLGFPFTRPVTAQEWPAMFARLQGRFLHLCDEKCADASHMFFMPSVPSEAARANAVFEVAGGGALDVESFLRMEAASAPPPSGKSRVIGTADIEGLARRLLRRKNEDVKAVGRALAAVAKGEPFAEAGGRDDMMFKASCHIAEAWPDMDQASVQALFKPSIEKMLAADPQAPGLEVLVQKLDRAQRKAEEQKNRDAQEEQDTRAANIRAAFGGTRSHPYTEQELDGFAKDAGVSRADFRKRWIMANGEHHYLFFDGQYRSIPVAKTSLWIACERDLAAAAPAGVGLRVNTKDSVRRKTPDELVEEYGTYVANVETDFRAQRTWYDLARDTLVEAPTPLRPLEAARCDAVEMWLECMAGPQYDKLQDWIAAVTLLDEPCAALYLSGDPGVGKTLLAEGISRLWTDRGPTEMAAVAGQFNDAAMSCPLIFADETVPDQLMKGDGTGWLRQLIQGRQMSLRRKYRPSTTLRGAVRVIFAANNDSLLRTRTLLTPQDAEAVSQRLLHVPADVMGRHALELIHEDHPEILRGFVRGDLIAKHALWLRDTRRVSAGKRFVVQGESSTLQRALLTSSDISASVVEWCLGFLSHERQQIENAKDLLVRVHAGRLLVHVKGLSKHWNDVIKTDKTYNAQTLANALASVSEPVTVRLPGIDGQPAEYRQVKLDVLHDWGEKKGYATREQIDAALAVPTQWAGMPQAAEPAREPGCDDAGPVPF